MRNLLLILIVAIVFSGCSGNGDGKGTLPPSSGRMGDIIIVMDSSQWKGELGDEIRATFREEVQGLPREEAMFKINYVDPRGFNDVLKRVKNLIFVMTLDQESRGSRILRNYFTKSSLDRIKTDPELFVHTVTDEFAKDQNIMYLFGQNEESLINNIRNNRKRLQGYFNNAEDKRLLRGLYKAKEGEGLRNMLIKDHECSMRIPFGYKLVINEPGFVWFRQINAESDMNIFITYKPYRSENAFDQEEIINLRDSVARNQLFEDPEKPETHIITETSVPYIPVTTKEINFNGNFAIEMRGLWKTNNLSMGGPFISYTMVDEALKRLYYIEGFVYSPGKKQREFVRELEVILSTFKTKEQLPGSGN